MYFEGHLYDWSDLTLVAIMLICVVFIALFLASPTAVGGGLVFWGSIDPDTTLFPQLI